MRMEKLTVATYAPVQIHGSGITGRPVEVLACTASAAEQSVQRQTNDKRLNLELPTGLQSESEEAISGLTPRLLPSTFVWTGSRLGQSLEHGLQ